MSTTLRQCKPSHTPEAESDQTAETGAKGLIGLSIFPEAACLSAGAGAFSGGNVPASMTIGLHDPHNHVPVTSPDDEWGDLLEIPAPREAIAKPLPARRSIREQSESADSNPAEQGIRIEGGARHPARLKPEGRLEVHEISGEVLRLAPEIEEIERAPRKVAFHARQPRAKPDVATAGEGREWGKQVRKSHRWMILGGGAALVSITLGLILLPLINKPSSKGGDNHVSWVEPEETIEGIDALNDMFSRRAEGESIFSRFVKAADPADFMPWVRDSKGMESLIKRHWHSLALGSDWNLPKDCVWDVFDASGLPAATLEGELPGFRKFSGCFVVENDRLLLDWKATTGYGTASFSDLARGTGDGSEIRGWLQSGTYYTTAFPETDYWVFKLAPPGNIDEMPVWCYVRQGTAEAQALRENFSGSKLEGPSREAAKVTLMLQRGSPSAAPNQWLLVKLLHKQWVSP